MVLAGRAWTVFAHTVAVSEVVVQSISPCFWRFCTFYFGQLIFCSASLLDGVHKDQLKSGAGTVEIPAAVCGILKGRVGSSRPSSGGGRAVMCWLTLQDKPTFSQTM